MYLIGITYVVEKVNNLWKPKNQKMVDKFIRLCKESRTLQTLEFIFFKCTGE